MNPKNSVTKMCMVLIVLTMLLASCTNATRPVPVTTFPTAIPATPAPMASPTLQPSPTATPPSPTPSPTPLVPWGGGLQVISKANASGLKEVGRLTDSRIIPVNIAWSWPSGRTPALAAYTYDSGTLTRSMEDWTIYDLGSLKQTVHVTVTHGSLRRFNWGLAMSPDGQLVALSGRFNAFKLYDASGELVRAFQGHTGRSLAVSFSSDGEQIASTSEDKTLRLWDVATGQVLRVIQLPQASGGAGQLFFSPDDRLLAVSGERDVYVWDVASGKLLHSGPGQGLAFSPDSKQLAVGAIDAVTIQVLDVDNWQPAFSLKGNATSDGENANGISGATFSPDGTLLASAVYDDKTVQLWDAQTGQAVFTLQKNTATNSVAFSPDGKVLATLESAVDANGEIVDSPDNGYHFWGVK